MALTADYRGARGSNAGDIFHELWALEQVLALLDPETRLRAVKVEGVDSQTKCEGQGVWDGVDCTLYFGGTDLESAESVEIAQLKYSGDPDRPWTIARLTASSGPRRNNSVLRRLATAYGAARQRMRPYTELRIRLVSNQPVDHGVLRFVETSAAHGQFRSDEVQDSERMRRATGLGDEDFLTFLAALDLSECGRASRFELREKVTLAVAKLVEGNATSDMANLQQKVQELMLPERSRERVTAQTLLSWFYIADKTALFPCPAEITKVERPIVRAATKNLADALTTGQKLIGFHGPGGCGKTTSLLQLAELLPSGSHVLLFDCFGGGRYRFSDDKRHLADNAFLQMANDLARQLRTPFFLLPGGRQQIDVKALLGRITNAASVLAEANPEALLVMAIDAADNAVMAATGASERCFVQDLTNTDPNSLPPNVRIVFSARTARVPSLQLPRSAPRVTCPPFSLQETTDYVRSVWPSASEVWIKQFHHLSGHVPRVQDYAVKAATGDQARALDALMPVGKKLHDVLKDRFFQALQKNGSEEAFYSIIGGLALLPPPIPPSYLAELSSTSEAAVVDVAYDLFPGLRHGDDGITVADEDFEYFLNEEAEEHKASEAAIADLLWGKCESDAYAATHVADSLVSAGRGRDLLALIQRDPSPRVIADPIVRREVVLRRLRLALRVSQSIGSRVETLKVVLLGAEANKQEESLREMLKQEVDLSVCFAKSTLRRLVLANKDGVAYQGSVLAQDAARAARAGDHLTARERLAQGNAWSRLRNDLPENEVQNWNVSVDDIVARAEAILEIDGPKAAASEIRRWRPPRVRIAAALKLVPALIARGKVDALAEVLQARIVPDPWNLMLIVPFALAGREVDRRTLSRSLAGVRKRHVPDSHRLFLPSSDNAEQGLFETLLSACELAVSIGVSRRVVLSVLRLLSTQLGSALLVSSPDIVDSAIRIWLLQRHLRTQQISVESLVTSLKLNSLPSKGRRRKRKSKPVVRKETQEELKSLVTAVAPIYVRRLGIITGAPSSLRDVSLGGQLADISLGGYKFEDDYHWRQVRAQIAISLMRLMALPNASWALLFEKAKSLLSGKDSPPHREGTARLLDLLLLRNDAHAAVLDAVGAEAMEIKNGRTSADDKVQGLVRCSRRLLRILPSDAEALFTDAVELTKEIDQEAHDQIELLASLARSGLPISDSTRRQYAADIFRFVSGAAARLSSYDGFPWNAAMAAMTRLCLPIALAASARWLDTGTNDLETTLQPLIAEALAEGSLTPEQATALSILLGQTDRNVTKEIVDQAQRRGVKLALIDELARDCLLHTAQHDQLAVGREILEYVDQASSAQSRVVQRLRATVAFIAALTAGPATSQNQAREGAVAETKLEESNVAAVKGHRFTTSAAISRVLDLPHSSTDYRRTRNLLASIRSTTSLGDRVAYLEALADLEHTALGGNDRARAIADALAAWKGSPAVEQWRDEKLPRLIVLRFSEFARWLNQGESLLAELLAEAGLSSSGRFGTLAEGVEASGVELSSRTLYGVAEMMVEQMSSDQVADVLAWYVPYLLARIPNDGRDTLELSDVPSATADAIARFLFALLGDIDTRLRWLAAHAVRRLARLEANEVIDRLVSHWDRKEDASFRDPGAPYYWLGARLWLVMALARVAAERPDTIAPHVNLLASIATDINLPHVLIREHAKRAVLQLVRRVAGLDAVIDVASVNTSGLPRVKRPRPTLSSAKPRRSPERLFQFDSIDTTRYWYAPLLECFPTASMEHFLVLAETWIVNRWAAPPNANWWATEPRKERHEASRHGLWTHGHGSLPTVERYGTHLEWHAMFCVVGELLETHSLAEPGGPYDTFEQWLQRWLPTEHEHWLSDTREAAPLDVRLWEPDPRPDQVWLHRARLSDFQVELGVTNRDHDGSVIIEGYYEVHFPTRVVTVLLTSALVSPDTAPALVRALQTVGDPSAVRLPEEGTDLEIDSNPYFLKGWLAKVERDEHFDRGDPLRREVSPIPLIPGAELSRVLGLTRQDRPAYLWTSASNANVSIEAEIWDDLPAGRYDERSRSVGSNGWRLWMRARDVQDFMIEEQKDVVYEVRIERRIREPYSTEYDWSGKKRKTFDKIFLFRRDGILEQATGRLGSWASTRRRART